MTRDQAIKKFRKDIDSQQKWSIFAEDVESLLHTIYDDFEKRICENCIHYSEKSIDYNDTTYDGNCCHYITDILFVEKNFGCNQFKRKEKG